MRRVEPAEAPQRHHHVARVTWHHQVQTQHAEELRSTAGECQEDVVSAEPLFQLKLFHNENESHLMVTVLTAVDLPLRHNKQTRNPYCKLYLLPDRRFVALQPDHCSICYSEKSKRRTKTLATTAEPRWNQTFVYAPLRRSDLPGRALEVTVYDYDRLGSGQYVGEVRWRAVRLCDASCRCWWS